MGQASCLLCILVVLSRRTFVEKREEGLHPDRRFRAHSGAFFPLSRTQASSERREFTGGLPKQGSAEMGEGTHGEGRLGEEGQVAGRL